MLIQGNFSKGYISKGINGIGSDNKTAGLGWVSITGQKVGEVGYVGLAAIVMSDINQGIYFQGDVAAVIDFTLANPGQALNPAAASQSGVKWGNSITLSPGTIVKAPVLFSAFRITFPAKGTVYVGVR